MKLKVDKEITKVMGSIFGENCSISRKDMRC